MHGGFSGRRAIFHFKTAGYMTYRIGFFALLLFMYSCAQVPRGNPGTAAEELTQQMLKAAAYEKWQKETAAVSFSFRGKHDIFWDKSRNLVEVKWSGWFDDYFVQFNKKTFASIVKVDGKVITDPKERKELTEKAYSHFINDTFWLNPAFHILSPGTKRSVVENKKLLVTYSSGGVTPGDSYLYEVDEGYRIKNMKMWVSIIPFKGVTASFSDYKTTETGLPIAVSHSLMIFSIDLKDLKTYAAYPQNEDRFAQLLKQTQASQ